MPWSVCLSVCAWTELRKQFPSNFCETSWDYRLSLCGAPIRVWGLSSQSGWMWAIFMDIFRRCLHTAYAPYALTYGQSTDHAVLQSPVRPFGTVYRRLFVSRQHWENFKDNWRRSFSAQPMERDCLHQRVSKPCSGKRLNCLWHWEVEYEIYFRGHCAPHTPLLEKFSHPKRVFNTT